MEKEVDIVVGSFKPKRKFISFITGSRRGGSKVRLNREVAYIDGAKLSGMLEGTKFKITICDEGTINFEEVDGSLSDISMIKRLISDIDDCDVTGYAEKFVVEGMEFTDEEGTKCYLEVEHLRPIDKLKAMSKEKPSLSNSGLSALEALFSKARENGIDIDKPIVEDIELEVVENKEPVVGKVSSFIEDTFSKMNDDKINELKSRIEDSKREKLKYTNDIKIAEGRVSQLDKELIVLETRLETMSPGEESNGYVFYVSHFKDSKMDMDESTRTIADRIAVIIGIKKDELSKHLSEGYYEIKIAKSDNLSECLTNEDVLSHLSKINGKIAGNGDHFEYRGDLNWHQIVDKMIRVGFSQSHEFDKVCGSISYDTEFGGGSPTLEKVEAKPNDTIFMKSEEVDEVLEEFKDSNGYEMGNEFLFAFGEDVNNYDPDCKFWFSVTPKSYYDNTGYTYDQHLEYVLNFPKHFEELSESMFVSSRTDIECIDAMINMGFKFSSTYQNDMEDPNVNAGLCQKYTINGILIGQYIRDNYPNSIV